MQIYYSAVSQPCYSLSEPSASSYRCEYHRTGFYDRIGSLGRLNMSFFFRPSGSLTRMKEGTTYRLCEKENKRSKKPECTC